MQLHRASIASCSLVTNDLPKLESHHPEGIVATGSARRSFLFTAWTTAIQTGFLTGKSYRANAIPHQVQSWRSIVQSRKGSISYGHAICCSPSVAQLVHTGPDFRPGWVRHLKPLCRMYLRAILGPIRHYGDGGIARRLARAWMNELQPGIFCERNCKQSINVWLEFGARRACGGNRQG